MNVHLTRLIAMLLISLAAPTLRAGETRPSAHPAYPMLDGRCGDVAALGEAHALPYGLTLHIFQDAGYVWLCVPLDGNDYGVLDMYLEAPNLPAPLNLHVSAQLGEWRADQPDSAPKTANSSKWWEIGGWLSNPLRFNGMIEDGSRPNFRQNPGREVQLSKTHFGQGTWKIQLKLTAIAAAEGQPVLFPPDKDGTRQTLSLKVD